MYPSRRAEREGVNETEFADFVHGRQAKLIGFAYVLCGNNHDAQDLVQGALVKAYLRWERIRETDHVEAYVRKIILHDFLGSWRRAWRRRETSSANLPEVASPAEMTTVDRVARDAVLTLPPRQRAVIALRFYDDLSVAQTAEILGCSEGTVKSQTSRAITTLRRSVSVEDLEGVPHD